MIMHPIIFKFTFSRSRTTPCKALNPSHNAMKSEHFLKSIYRTPWPTSCFTGSNQCKKVKFAPNGTQNEKSCSFFRNFTPRNRLVQGGEMDWPGRFQNNGLICDKCTCTWIRTHHWGDLPYLVQFSIHRHLNQDLFCKIFSKKDNFRKW